MDIGEFLQVAALICLTWKPQILLIVFIDDIYEINLQGQ